LRGNKLKNIFLKNQKGFSLIEMMVVVVILGLIVLGLVTFFTGGAKSWVTGQSQLTAQRNARQAIDLMVREIREGNEVKDGSDIFIKVAIPEFKTDTSTIPAYEVTYILSVTTIKRGTTPLIDNVLKIAGEDIFKYYDSVKQYITNHSDPYIDLLNNISKISKIHIDLKVDVDKDGSPDVTLNTDVNLRNYGYINE